MKNLIAVLLVIALVTLVACGSKAPPAAPPGEPTGTVETREVDKLAMNIDKAGNDVLDVSSLDTLESDLTDIPVE